MFLVKEEKNSFEWKYEDTNNFRVANSRANWDILKKILTRNINK